MAHCPEIITTGQSQGRARMLARAFGHWFDLDAAAAAATGLDLNRASDTAGGLRERIVRTLAGRAPGGEPWAALFAEALSEADPDAAALVGAAAVDGIVADGRACAQLMEWEARLAALATRPCGGPSAQAAAALALRRGLVALVLRGDAQAAWTIWDDGVHQAERAASEPLQLALTGARGVAECLAGAVTRADVLVSDAWVLCEVKARSRLPCLLVTVALSLIRLMMDRSSDALALLQRTCAAVAFEGLPESLQVLVWSLGMHAAADVGDTDRVADWSRAVADRTVPVPRLLLHACRHYVLGAMALRQGDALRARIHADACIGVGERAGALLPGYIGRLLRLQALAELADAGASLRTEAAQWIPTWSACGMARLAAVAHLELAARDVRAGELDRARRAWFAALAALPPGESLRPLNRSGVWLEALRVRLFPMGDRCDATTAAVRIRTLGEFSVEIGGRRIFDRDWKGSRTKTLLMALICEGGSKVSVDRLADLLWPDSDGAQARQNLKVALWRLRRLGCEGPPEVNWVHVKQGRVSLPAGLVQVDALEFRNVARAALMPGADVGLMREALAAQAESFLPMEDNLPWVAAFRKGLMGLKQAVQARIAGCGEQGAVRVVGEACTSELNGA